MNNLVKTDALTLSCASGFFIGALSKAQSSNPAGIWEVPLWRNGTGRATARSEQRLSRFGETANPRGDARIKPAKHAGFFFRPVTTPDAGAFIFSLRHIMAGAYPSRMEELVAIYSCLCDKTRLRILHLLRRSPLCVCHIQTILREPQVKVSKHLGYLKAHGIVDVSREGKWRVYRLTKKRSKMVESNLACLQDCAAEDPIFRRDLRTLETLLLRPDENGGAACAPVVSSGNRRNR